MNAILGRSKRERRLAVRGGFNLTAEMLVVLALVVIAYAFLAGLRTLSEFDLGWQLATGRWIVQHHHIPSTDVFSYTAHGQPWIYPVGSGLFFYGAYLLGNTAALSWAGAVACGGTIALLLRRGSAVTPVLATLAVPLIAIRTRPRADMFTVVLFAAFLSLLWQQHQTGRSRLWLLPILMIAWVNLHLGFIAGLALIVGYVLLEALEIIWPERRDDAVNRLRHAWPWLIATFGATLANPWGWGIYRALIHQENALAALSQWISEWAPAKLNRTVLSIGLSLRNPGGAFYVMLLIAALAVPLALWRKQFGAAVLLGGAAAVAVQHIRFEALFGIVIVIVAGAVLTSGLDALRAKTGRTRLGMALCVLGLACIRSADLVSDRSYLANSDLGSFGTGLSWWFPERAVAFITRENIPGQIFNSYNEGGYFTWRLGPKYPDYIDGRALPFGPNLFIRNRELMTTSPDSQEWGQEAERYDINALLVPLGRYNGVGLFPMLRQFCGSSVWRPVYLDEVSAVFVRRTPENERLIARLQIQCDTIPIPAVLPHGRTTAAFNSWANAAAVLRALGRNAEAFEATTKALAIFPDSAFVHFLRANLWGEAGNLAEAEREFLLSARLEPNGTTWSILAAVYHREGRLADEVHARERARELSPPP